MSDDYQIHIPPSFFALYTDARQRLAEPIATVRERYEVCEDLANHLVCARAGAATMSRCRRKRRSSRASMTA